MSNDNINYMDLNEFRDLGFLQEANRQFFHPLGLALEVTTDDKTGAVTGLGGIWDYRDDPEGVLFTGALDVEKVTRVSDEADRHRAARLELLGSVIQEVPE